MDVFELDITSERIIIYIIIAENIQKHVKEL